MLSFYFTTRWVLATFLLLASTEGIQAQALAITTVIPMANASAASHTGPITVSFNQALTPGSAGALKVFSNQRGGLRTRGTTLAVVNGSTLNFMPTAYPFMPGETVKYTVTTAAASSSGALMQSRVGQFTTAVDGTGRGAFRSGTDVTMNSAAPQRIVVGDIDGDGDVDILSIGTITTPTTPTGPSRTVTIHTNNGSGLFSSSQGVSVGNNIPTNIALGDTDGDGDLDLLITIIGSTKTSKGTVSIHTNNGSGLFSSSQSVLVGNTPTSIALGDIDGDGDLDLLTANYGNQNGNPTGLPTSLDFPSNTVSIRFNDGGIFDGDRDATVNFGPLKVILGDVDGDGDLDLITVNIGYYTRSTTTLGNTVSVRLNDGSGTFGGTQNVVVGSYPQDVAVVDLDSDGDLDILVNDNSMSECFNDGTGTFNVNQNAESLGGSNMELGDIDSDGDVDLLAVSSADLVKVRLNNGRGIFSNPQNVIVGTDPRDLALRDVDGDGDLDLFTANYNHAASGSISINFNENNPLTVATNNTPKSFTLYPNPTHGSATLIGASPKAPLTILDTVGRLVITTTADATGTAHLVLPAGLPSGVYLVRSENQVRRLVVE